jgi:uncharacterized protein DUF4352
VTYQPQYDPNQQPASGPPSYGPSQEQLQYSPPQAQQQYGPPLGQPYGGPQPGYQPHAQPPKKRKKWPFIVGGVVLVMILGCVGMFTLFGIGAKKVADDLDNNVQGKNAVAGKMNTPATDGKFQFTVTGMKCGVDSVGPEGFGQKAQGEFCLVSVSIKNVGQSAEVFNDSSQKAYDKANTEYSVDSGAAIYANGDASTFLEQINPGNTVKGKLVFDVPQGTKLASVVLHESMYTAGVKIPLK